MAAALERQTDIYLPPLASQLLGSIGLSKGDVRAAIDAVHEVRGKDAARRQPTGSGTGNRYRTGTDAGTGPVPDWWYRILSPCQADTGPMHGI